MRNVREAREVLATCETEGWTIIRGMVCRQIEAVTRQVLEGKLDYHEYQSSVQLLKKLNSIVEIHGDAIDMVNNNEGSN